MSKQAITSTQLLKSFRKASTPRKSSRTISPFSMRFTPEERAWLDEQAGHRPLGDYIRTQLLGDMAKKRRTLRKPKADDQKLSMLLAMLGESRLSSNLNQLAKHANMGTLDISDDVERQLEDACASIIAMRDALLVALGQRPKNKQEDGK